MDDDFLTAHPDMALISLFDDDESRWQAIVTRNPNADGFFVYAVTTTRIFCRPICKARLARRRNTVFFADGAAAARAGFRPCKRCRPDIAGFMPEEAAVQKIRRFVRDREAAAAAADAGAIAVGEGSGNGGGGGVGDGVPRLMSLSQMAAQTGLSKWHFHRVFKKCVGVTPGDYVLREREARRLRQDALAEDAALFDLVNFDFDLPPANDGEAQQAAAAAAVVPPVETAAVSAPGNTNELGPSTWTIDDLLIWPEDTWKAVYEAGNYWEPQPGTGT